MTTLHDVEDVLGRPWKLSFGLSQFHGHDSWLVCEVALELNKEMVREVKGMNARNREAFGQKAKYETSPSKELHSGDHM